MKKQTAKGKMHFYFPNIATCILLSDDGKEIRKSKEKKVTLEPIKF